MRGEGERGRERERERERERMSVILETSLGDLVVDLFVEEAPKACTNFLKLCKMKYYNNCLFHTVEKDFIAQTGDPTNTGKGGESIWGLLYGQQARFFEAEIHPSLSHTKPGLLSTANTLGKDKNTSSFFLTLGYDLQRLDKKHTIFGQVVEGMGVLLQINETFCDDEGKPFRVIRVRHTAVLDDPFPDPAGMEAPDASPEPLRLPDGRLDDEEPLDADQGLDEEAREERKREEEARARTDVLVMVGDLGSEKEAPPENVLFICKLNPVTEEEDLEIIFSQFGKVVGCEIIRDHVTGDSLCFGFVEFADKASCEKAYLKMDAVVVDDRRIRVDFSQSTSRNTKAGPKGKGKYGHLMGRGQGRDEQPPQQQRRLEARREAPRAGRQYDMVFDEPRAGSKRPRREDEPVRKERRRNDRRDGRGDGRDYRKDDRRDDRRDKDRHKDPRRDDRRDDHRRDDNRRDDRRRDDRRRDDHRRDDHRRDDRRSDRRDDRRDERRDDRRDRDRHSSGRDSRREEGRSEERRRA